MRSIYTHQCAACGEFSFKFYEGSHNDGNYTWTCDDCGIEVKLTFSNGGKQLTQEPTGRRCEKALFLLKLRNNPKFMIIDRGDAWDGNLDQAVYYYEEHTCPSNVLRCEEVIADGEVDPHGVFNVVAGCLITGPSAQDEEDVIERMKAMAAELTGLNYVCSVMASPIFSIPPIKVFSSRVSSPNAD